MTHQQTSDQPATASARPQTGGDVLVRVMHRHGIDVAFGVISIHNLPLVEAVARDLRFVEMRHEAACVNAADAYARATGKIGVALTSTGTGAGNAAGSMVEALTAGSRVLHITGQVESQWVGSNQGVIHEVPRQLQMLDAVSKHAAGITTADGVEAVLEEAIGHILTAPQGPASVEWPTDLQYLARPDAQTPATAGTAAPVPAVADADLAAAAARIAAARRPIIWAGGGAAGAGTELAELVHRLGAGLITSNSGRGIVPEDDDLVIGNFGSTPQGAALLAEADLLISIGTHFRSNETRTYHLQLTNEHIGINLDPAALSRPYPATTGLLGDAQPVLAGLLTHLGEPATDPAWTDRVRAVRTEVRENLYAVIGGYAEICRELRAQLPREAVVARDVTIPSSQWGNRLLDFYARESNIFPLGGGIGQGLAMGIGAAVGRPEVPTVVMAGDGGFAVHLGELASLGGTGAQCVVIVFNDDGYGVLRNMQQANGFDRAGVDLFTPDFGALAASFRMPYWRTGIPGTFGPALREALAVGGPALIEVVIDDLSPAPGAFTPPVHIPKPDGDAA
ncbi:thiamine pyrophosphate-binding protein [Granulicoccus phenolivorans]|uniref:thiamine pyrophosphate-binding protein n=1 Tax=Granulicoccus phenolivorans TaxID=266854 RepID=UPI00047B8B9D|nr:thiamine pyrophosphate-binding protein [Granulicoccus phenolivorans]